MVLIQVPNHMAPAILLLDCVNFIICCSVYLSPHISDTKRSSDGQCRYPEETELKDDNSVIETDSAKNWNMYLINSRNII
jgi:hypothetical protein